MMNCPTWSWLAFSALVFLVGSSAAVTPAPGKRTGPDCTELVNKTDDVLNDSWWLARQAELKSVNLEKHPGDLVSAVGVMISVFKHSVIRANCNEAEHRTWAEKELKLIKTGPLPARANATWRQVATKKLSQMREKDHAIFLMHLKMDHTGMNRLTTALGLAKLGVSGPLAGRRRASQQGLEQALALCAEALPGKNAPPPSVAIHRLEMLIKALNGVAAGPHAPEGTRHLVDDAVNALAEVKLLKDADKIDVKVQALMKEVSEYKASLDTRMKTLHSVDTSERKQFYETQSNKLFDKLYEIQDYPMAKQVAVLAEPVFKELPVVQALAMNHTNEPLAIQVGTWLDAEKQALKDRAAALRIKRSSAFRNKLAAANPHDDQKKVNVLAGIVGQLEGRIESLEGHEKQLQRLDDQNEEAAKQKHRLILKAKAKMQVESDALRQAVQGIEAGKTDGLQQAMKVIQSIG